MASTFNAAQGDTEAEKHDREQRRRQLHDVPLQATGGPDVWPRWEFMDEKLGPNGDLKTHLSSQMRIYLIAMHFLLSVGTYTIFEVVGPFMS